MQINILAQFYCDILILNIFQQCFEEKNLVTAKLY